MALQDLTPQLRTRLSRMERAVGWFVLLATALLLFGFGYYLYTTATRKGWFKIKAPYYTYISRATGLGVGDQITMMGFPVGQITEVTAQPPEDWEHDVYIGFEIIQPFYDYMWTRGSVAFTTDSLLGKRTLEVSKGTNGYPTYLFFAFRQMTVTDAESLPELQKWKLAEEIYDATGTNLLFKANQPLTTDLLQKISGLGIKQIRVVDTRQKKKNITAVWNNRQGYFEPFYKTNRYELPMNETPAISDRANRLVAQIEAALPSFLNLTNEVSGVVSNASQLTANLSVIAERARPMITNLSIISEHLKNPQGSLGEWLIPTNLNLQLQTTLNNANLTMTNANTNLAVLAEELSRSLDSLASITSNLNNQVEVNTNILSRISDVVVHSDQFVQGLKRHWLLRSAFRTPKTNAPPARSPKDASQRKK
ncbi:MAG: Mammalian cell entry related domain protein [Pedosphaera sp.]|nr:Mammalian cell entry related domain protein [Pedosphaera sp.]